MTIDKKRKESKHLSAFVGRSFLDNDKKVWYELREILDSLKPMGFDFEDAKEGQIRPISKKVKERIARNDIYIGVLTKRHPIWQPPTSLIKNWLYPLKLYVPQEWATTEWVIEEIGYAIGKDRKVLLLIENGVNFPMSDLDGDTQRIPFNRGNLHASQNEISEMILNLISERVISKEEPASVTAIDANNQDQDTQLQKPSLTDQLVAICVHVRSGDYYKADQIQEEVIQNEPNSEQRSFAESYILGMRAKNNDHNALDHLKQKCKDNPSDYYTVIDLAEVYQSFRESGTAIELLVKHLDIVPKNKCNILAVKAAKIYCKKDDTDKAISLLLKYLQIEENESAQISLYLGIAYAAKKVNNSELEIAFLEKVLTITPEDNNTRFQLAHVYFNNGLNKLSAYHNELVVTHTNWPSASNNLGAAYGELGFKGNQNRLYESVAEQEFLAKANIAVIQANAGFYSEARTLANTVLTNTASDDNDNETAINRARYALEEITNSESTEKEAIDKIADDTKAEREFMCSYAKAYCAPPLDDDKGVYSTSHGEIEIVRTPENIKGLGKLTKKVGLGLADSILPYIGGIGQESRRTVSYSLTLSAELHGQAGTFELDILTLSEPRTVLGSVPDTIKGLLYFQNNGSIIQFLEFNEKERIVKSALLKR